MKKWLIFTVSRLVRFPNNPSHYSLPRLLDTLMGIFGRMCGRSLFFPTADYLEAPVRNLLSLVLILLVTGLAAPAIAEDPPVFSFKFGSTGSTGDGEFLNPTGMAFDLSGNIYVTDPQVNRVQKFTSGGVFISKFGSGGNGDGQFNIPIGLSIDSSGNLFISEFTNLYGKKVSQRSDGTRGTGRRYASS